MSFNPDSGNFLPNEIVSEIISYLDTRNLKNLALVHRHLCPVACQQLYRHYDIDFIAKQRYISPPETHRLRIKDEVTNDRPFEAAKYSFESRANDVRYISIDISYENLCDIRGKSGFKKPIRSLFAKRNPEAAKYNWNDTVITRDNQVDCLKHLLGPFKIITRINLINLTDIPFGGAYELLDFVFSDFPSLVHLAISHEILAWKFRYTERDSRYSKQQLAAVGPSASCTPVASLKSLRIGLYNARGTGTLDQHKELYGPTIDHFCQIIGKYPTVISTITSLEAHLVDGFDGLWHEFLINSQHKLKLPNLRKVLAERPDHPQGDFKFPLVQQPDLQNVTTLSLHVMLRHMCLNNMFPHALNTFPNIQTLHLNVFKAPMPYVRPIYFKEVRWIAIPMLRDLCGTSSSAATLKEVHIHTEGRKFDEFVDRKVNLVFDLERKPGSVAAGKGDIVWTVSPRSDFVTGIYEKGDEMDGAYDAADWR